MVNFRSFTKHILVIAVMLFATNLHAEWQLTGGQELTSDAVDFWDVSNGGPSEALQLRFLGPLEEFGFVQGYDYIARTGLNVYFNIKDGAGDIRSKIIRAVQKKAPDRSFLNKMVAIIQAKQGVARNPPTSEQRIACLEKTVAELQTMCEASNQRLLCLEEKLELMQGGCALPKIATPIASFVQVEASAPPSEEGDVVNP